MRATFADESWKTNFWFEHIVLAHINLKQNLDWFYELLFKLKQDNPELEEFKSYKVIDLMSKLDVETRKRIWKKLQDTIIIVQDPKEYASNAGLCVLPDGGFKFRYENKELFIDRNHRDFNSLNKMLQRELSKLILLESPITKINFSLSELPRLRPRVEFFSPENILSLINKKDSKKEVMGVIKLAARLCSAFFEIIDPSTKKRILEQFYIYKSDFLFVLPNYHQEMLKQAVSSNRFFDKGHQLSTDIIKQCFDIIDENLRYDQHEEGTFLCGQVGELDSKESIEIQACDWASGIAHNIYENEGSKGLKERFRCVIFNGKIM